MFKIVVCSLSGGQGKTTCSLFLGQKLASQRFATLFVDADPLRDLTTYLNVELQDSQPTLLEVLRGECTVLEAIYQVPDTTDLYVLPAKMQLNQLTASSVGRDGGNPKQLRHRLKAIEQKFQVCIIDTPPQDLTINTLALLATDTVLIPVEASVKGYRSLIYTLDLIAELEKNHAITIEILGIVPFRDRWVGSRQSQESRLAIAGIQEEVGERLLLASIKESELYKRAINQATTLSAMGIAELEDPFEILAKKIQTRLNIKSEEEQCQTVF
jgi:chromosome partitioning protein